MNLIQRDGQQWACFRFRCLRDVRSTVKFVYDPSWDKYTDDFDWQNAIGVTVMELKISDPAVGKRTIAKLNEVMRLGKLSSREYFENLMESVVRTDQSIWIECIATIPISLRTDLFDYAKSQLLDVDFMPHPGVVFPPTNSQESIEVAKRQLRPRYIEFLDLLESAVDSGKSSVGGE